MRMKLLCIGPGRVHMVDRLADPDSHFCPDGLREFLREALLTRRSTALPPPWQGLQASAAEHQGALSVRVLGADAAPIVTLGVASHKAHGRPLWRVLTALVPEECLANDPEPPSRRWCAWVWHGGHAGDARQESMRQLVLGFVQAVARAWMEEKTVTRGSREKSASAPHGASGVSADA